MLSPTNVVDTVKLYWGDFRREVERVDRIDRYMHGEHEGPYTPSTATSEYKLLTQRSVSNWLPLVVDTHAQTLYVEGFRPSYEVPDGTDGPWQKYWQPNDMDSRQIAIHRAALTYGTSYVLVMPGDPTPVIRGFSPRQMIAFYRDPLVDIWPEFAIRRVSKNEVFLYDATHKYTLRYDPEATRDSDKWSYRGEEAHDIGRCPVIRYQDRPDLDGRAAGEVEPLIPVQDRINQTAFDLLMAQSYGAFKVRTISGMATPVGPDGKPLTTVELSIKRFLVSEDPDTKFGQLDETTLQGYIDALDLAVRHMSAISQTPPHSLLGQMANLSAEALVAAESGKSRKGEEIRHNFGQAHEQVFIACGLAAADDRTASDPSAQVVWRDTEARSLSQTVDALGKAAQLLGIPEEALWERIPGVTGTDVERWRKMRAQGDPLTQLQTFMEAQTAELEGGAETGQPTLKEQADALGALIRAGVDPADAAARVGLPGIRFTGAVPVSLRLPAEDASELEAQ